MPLPHCRLLDAALQESKPQWETKTIAAICRTCNTTKLTAKKVSDESDKLFLTMFVKECGPMTVSAMVIYVSVLIIWVALGGLQILAQSPNHYSKKSTFVTICLEI